ncbi:alpha/beta hydrolase [Liquorilactobacillus sicerae]|uniref:alpha/beta hydrolase n=1 Tax=Liquorilactobacillus sicerae TaxID=1416943 RepID=UPI00247FFAC2|nr:alpha/beta hydrolase [Liquorilactobacillus sicerae]
MNRGKKFGLGLIAIVLISLIGFLTFKKIDTKVAANNAIPTILVHGWGSSKAAEYPIAKQAATEKKAQFALNVVVKRNGKIKITGSLSHKKYPIIFLVFKDNRAGEKKDLIWLHRVMLRLKRHYNVKTYNAIGHSMGAYVLVAYNAKYGNRSQLPRLRKLALIAGPFNGILNLHKSSQPKNGELVKLWDDYYQQNSLQKDGLPKIIHPEYRYLLQHKTNFPTQAQVLNIYGDLKNGTDSDGTVSTISVRSLAYLLKKQIAAYHELKITGRQAQHSNMPRNNHQVINNVVNFIWGK